MEEHFKHLEDRITELQTKTNTVKRVVVSPYIPVSLFVNGPAGEDACYLPKGKVTQMALSLTGPKTATLSLNFVQAGRNVTEEIAIKTGQVILKHGIEIEDWSIIRAKIITDDLMARLVIGFNFHPTASYVAEKGEVDA